VQAEFHFKTELLESASDAELVDLATAREQSAPRRTLDDSRQYGKCMELVFGKQFKIASWENSLRTMLPGEVAQFFVPSSVCS